MNELKFGQHPNWPTSFQATIQFDNGYCASVIYGPDCYGQGPEDDTYEIAIINPKGEFVALSEHDDVLGWQTMDKVQEIINKYKEI